MFDRFLTIVRSLFGLPPDPWQWATVYLKGGEALRGLIRGAGSPVVSVRALRPDGTWETYAFTAAVVRVVHLSAELVVRASVVRAGAAQRTPCGAHSPSPALRALCAYCGRLRSEHEGSSS